MFTGIVRSTAKVKSIKHNKDILAVSITSPKDMKTKIGDSIAVSGVCSTVARKTGNTVGFDYMPETLRASNVGSLKTGDMVNIEPSLKYGDPIDGHFVTGHVDTIAMIKAIGINRKSKTFTISIPKAFRRYIAYKGSITIDGVAITVSKKLSDGCEVSLIPYTLKHTNFCLKKVGDVINIECDIISKYILSYEK